MHPTGQQGTYGLSTPSGRTRARVTAGGNQDGNERGCTTHLFTPIAPLATFSLAQVTRTTQSQHETGQSSQLELEEYAGDNTTEKGRLATKHQSTIEAIHGHMCISNAARGRLHVRCPLGLLEMGDHHPLDRSLVTHAGCRANQWERWL